MIAFFRFAWVAILLACIACVSAIVTMQFAVHGQEVRIPDFKGQTVAEATSNAAALGLDLNATQRFYSTELPAGRVVMQSPVAGAQVRRGYNLAVAVSLGPQRVAVPAVLGMDEHAAILAIRQAGLELGALHHMPDRAVAAGTVIAQDPQPHATGAANPSVNLLVATAQPVLPTDEWFVMPDETGLAYTEASAALTRAGLQVQSVPAPPPPANGKPIVSGTITGQQPAAGSRIEKQTPIVLAVAP